MTGCIAILEDDALREEAMRRVVAGLGTGHEVRVFARAPAMIAWLAGALHECAVVSLDNDLLAEGPTDEPGSGRDVAEALATRPPACPVIVHTANHLAAPSMRYTLELAGGRVARVVPYGDVEWVDTAWARAIRELLGLRDREPGGGLGPPAAWPTPPGGR